MTSRGCKRISATNVRMVIGMEEDEIFTIKARRCKRCGGILTSKQAVEEGYGHVCKMKTKEEEEKRRPIDGQINLLDIFGQERNEEDL